MNVTANQFYVFISCLAFGGVTGIIYSLFGLIKFSVKIKAIKVIEDILFFVIFTAGYIIYSYIMGFPSIRAYMLFGAVLGLYLYGKSFNFILAKSGKMTYNIINNKLRKKKDRIDERGKV